MTGPQQRTKARNLERILDTHRAWERRTMADLRVLGFKFQTIDAAYRYLSAQKTLARMSADDLVEFVASHNKKES